MPHWQVRDPDNTLAKTKRQVRIYATKHNITTAQALAQLIKIALKK